MELGILGPGLAGRAGAHLGPQLRPARRVADHLLADVAGAGAGPGGPAGGAGRPRCCRGSSRCRPTSGAATWPAPPSRLLAVQSGGTAAARAQAVCFVDIVGYTSRSKSLDESELVDWLEHFEDAATGIVVDHGGRIIKTIGDEILFVADDPAAAAEIALLLTERGADPDDPFPSVRAGIAHGEVVSRLGDVFGPVVNIASRLTSVARPGTVLVDRRRLRGALGAGRRPTRTTSRTAPPAAGRATPATSAYRFRRMRRTLGQGLLAAAVVGAAPLSRRSSRRPTRPATGRRFRRRRPERETGPGAGNRHRPRNVEARPLSTGDTTTTGQRKNLRDAA